MNQYEHGLQAGVARLFELCLDPERTWWSAIDHGAGKMSKRSAGMMKARGVKRGLPDFILMWSDRDIEELIGIEMKVGNGKLTPAQIDVRDAWGVMGHQVYVARSIKEVQEILDHCRIPVRRRMTVF